MPQTTRDGCRLHYLVDGADTAPALVLLHSIGTSASLWAPQVPAFATDGQSDQASAAVQDLSTPSYPHFRVIRCDARGHGQSDAPSGDYTLEQLGTDVLAVL